MAVGDADSVLIVMDRVVMFDCSDEEISLFNWLCRHPLI